MKTRTITASMTEVFRLARRDGQIFGLTAHDADITSGDTIYRAHGSFATARGVDQRSDLKTGALEIEGILSSDIFNEDDLRAGLFDHAEILFGLCDWQRPEDGVLVLRRGWLGEVVVMGDKFATELRGLSDILHNRLGDIYAPECGHCLGDARCRVDLALYEKTGSVTATNDAISFFDETRNEPDATFAQGVLTWLSGANQGFSADIRAWDATQKKMTLWLAPPHPVALGDSFKIIAGCDKRFSTCREKFANALNFGGYPHLPGQGRILNYP